ncbi:hypothetical protein [Streptomyces crystallinus]|uniref:Uncharacterized protein n=1 Tax=Streptomyces crystallinus TaxID=68191 RepID=A0ABP3Q5L6_9ACTN
MCGNDFFATEDRDKLGSAGARLYKAFEELGLDDLNSVELDEPCTHRHCCPTQVVMLSLGSYRLGVVNRVADRLEQIAKALPPEELHN